TEVARRPRRDRDRVREGGIAVVGSAKLAAREREMLVERVDALIREEHVEDHERVEVDDVHRDGGKPEIVAGICHGRSERIAGGAERLAGDGRLADELLAADRVEAEVT